MTELLHIDPLILKIVLALTILAIASASTGVFAYIMEDSLSADAIAHSTLPGVCIGFMFAGTKESLALYVGALAFGIICQFLISKINQHSKLKKDPITAVVLTTLFALGLVLTKYILHSHQYTNKSGIKNFLFGQAASIQNYDLIFSAIVASIILVLIALFGRALKTLAFDPTQFQMYGWPKNTVKIFFDIILTLTVIIGIQAVGVVLMSALIITPAVIARSISHNFKKMFFIAISFNVMAALGGTFISYQFENPTGPWIIVVLSLISFVSIPVGGRILNRKS